MQSYAMRGIITLNKTYIFSRPTSFAISILLPSIVHINNAPFRQNFMLLLLSFFLPKIYLVPLASLPTVLMCSLTSVAGMIISAMDTL